MLAKIGIRPVIDGRQFGIRESLEEQTMQLALTLAAGKPIPRETYVPDQVFTAETLAAPGAGLVPRGY